MKKNPFIKALCAITALLFWIALWYLAAKKVDQSLVLPTPVEVFRRLVELSATREFYRVILTSFVRVMLGFSSAMLSGFLLAALAHFFPIVKTLFSPFMAIIKATPVASFILLVLLWIDKGVVPIFISFLMVIPIAWQNTLLGFEKRDPLLTETAKVFRIPLFRKLFKIDLPQILPFLLSAAKTSVGLAWKAGVAAEVLAMPKRSVGLMIYQAKFYLESVDLYAWTLAIILLSLLPEGLFFIAKHRKGGNRA